MTIFGWDASHYDWSRGSMDITAAVKDGITFFTHKATESNNMKDDKFPEAMNRAKAAGVRFIGAYHVVRSSPSASTQADYFLNYVRASAPWWKSFDGWFFQADVEVWPYDNVPAKTGEDFADAVEQKSGKRCIVYASKGQYADKFSGTSHELWNANYASNNIDKYRRLYDSHGGDKNPGWTTYSGKFPAILQYGSKAIIGNQSTCDANAYQGTVEDFAKMIGASMASNDFTSPCTSKTDFMQRSRDDILADLENVRNWLFALPTDTASINPPASGSRLDLLVNNILSGVPVTLSDESINKIVEGLASKFLSYDDAVKAGQEALRKGAGN